MLDTYIETRSDLNFLEVWSIAKRLASVVDVYTFTCISWILRYIDISRQTLIKLFVNHHGYD